jgi:hypothetical protein
MEADEPVAKIDHLVYATPELETGIAAIEKLLGVRPALGGRHPGYGTRNALVSLGNDVYLEVIGPDPEQPEPEGPRVFRIDELDEARLVTWAAKESALESRVRAASRGGVELGEILSGGRQTPDGAFLSWKVTDPRVIHGHGLVPFLIDWGSTPHPAHSAPQGCALIELRAEHPEAARVREMLSAVGQDLVVNSSSAPALAATIETPRGRVELR